MKLRDNKGFTEIDIGIALVILLLMISLIGSLFYNFSTSTKSIERENKATYIAIQIIEALKVTDYDDIEDEMSIENLQRVIQVENGYSVNIAVENYNEIEGNEDLEDLIKNVTVTVKYNVNNIEQKVELKTSIVDQNYL